MNEVLFICTGNAARSQFAEAIYRDRYGDNAQSAGTEVIKGKPLPDDVVSVLDEHSLSHENLYRKQLNQNLALTARKLVLMTEESLPAYLDQARHIIFWYIDDPRGKGLEAHRKAFEEVSAAMDKEFGDKK